LFEAEQKGEQFVQTFYHFLYKTVHVEAHLKFEKSSVAGGSRTGRYGSSKDNVWWNGV